MIRPIASGVVLALLSALIHALGLLVLLYWQSRQWPRIEENFGPRRNLPVFPLLFGALESPTGLLPLGWPGAFFFNTVHRLFEIRVLRWQQNGA